MTQDKKFPIHLYKRTSLIFLVAPFIISFLRAFTKTLETHTGMRVNGRLVEAHPFHSVGEAGSFFISQYLEVLWYLVLTFWFMAVVGFLYYFFKSKAASESSD